MAADSLSVSISHCMRMTAANKRVEPTSTARSGFCVFLGISFLSDYLAVAVAHPQRWAMGLVRLSVRHTIVRALGIPHFHM
jgi:hypothetical protein